MCFNTPVTGSTWVYYDSAGSNMSLSEPLVRNFGPKWRHRGAIVKLHVHGLLQMRAQPWPRMSLLVPKFLNNASTLEKFLLGALYNTYEEHLAGVLEQTEEFETFDN